MSPLSRSPVDRVRRQWSDPKNHHRYCVLWRRNFEVESVSGRPMESMLINRIRAIGALGLLVMAACTPSGTEAELEQAPDYKADIRQVCAELPGKYVYFSERKPIWGDACAKALLEIEQAETGLQFLRILERLLDDLYDPHISLNTNSASSPRLLPSGTDIWLEPENQAQVIVAVRPGGGAAHVGIKVGDKLVSFNALSSSELIATRVHSKSEINSTQRQVWALNAAVAGYRNEPRLIVVERDSVQISLKLSDPEPERADETVSARVLQTGVGYIRFNNSLGNSDTISAFNDALDDLSDSKGLVIDLRDTPGGGNTGVAEPILGRLVSVNTPYQITVDPKRGPTTRSISPTGPWAYDQPIVTLVGRWTGSMGEGMAVGLDGMARAELMGDCMAGLAGGTDDLLLAQSGISIRIPAYDLTHIDGTPRHLWCLEAPQTADMGNEEDTLLKRAILRIEAMNAQ